MATRLCLLLTLAACGGSAPAPFLGRLPRLGTSGSAEEVVFGHKVSAREDLSLVVARCNESESSIRAWLYGFDKAFRPSSILVYEHCGQRLQLAGLPLHSIPLSHNEGFECDVYLRYILSHYDSLPKHTMFLQANPLDHLAGAKRWAADPPYPWSSLRSCLRKDKGYVSVGYYAQSLNLKWVRDPPKNPFAPAYQAKKMVEWIDAARPTTHSVSMLRSFGGAQFMARRDHILKIPKSTYAKLQQLVDTQNKACFGMERLWQYLIGGVGDVVSGAECNRFAAGCTLTQDNPLSCPVKGEVCIQSGTQWFC